MDDGFHFGQVRDAVQAIDPNLVALACGSYRRGKATCGDVDILISHPDGKSHKGVFSKVLQSLHDSGKLCHFACQEFFFVAFSQVCCLEKLTLQLLFLRFSDRRPGQP